MSSTLPRNWTVAPLADLAETCLGKMLDKGKARKGTPQRYLRNINVRWGSFDLNDLFEMPFEDRESDRYGLKAGDLVVCEGGEPGRCAVWLGGTDQIMFQKALHRVRPYGLLDAKYLQYHITDDAKGQRLDSLFTGTTIRHLTGAAFAEYEVRLPPLNEQRRIVAKIDALTAKSRRAKDALDAIPALLDKLRQSILAAAFRGELTADWRAAHPDVEPASKLLDRIRAERRRRWEEAELAKMKAKGKAPADDRWKAKYQEPEPVDESGLPELPEGWCWARLPELGLLARGRSRHRPRNDPKLYGDKIPFIQTGDVARSGGTVTTYTQMYSPIGIEQSRIFPAGTLCITIAANIAETALLGFDACFPDSVVGFTPDSELTTARAIEFFIRYTKNNIQQFAPGTAQKNINLEILGELVVPLMPPAELSIIRNRLEQAVAAVEKLETGLEYQAQDLHELESSILAKAFRGELVPQDPNDEPASVLLERIRTESSAQPQKNSRRRKVKTA